MKTIITAIALTIAASSAMAVESCGPSVDFGFEQNGTNTNSNESQFGDYSSSNRGQDKGVTASIGLTWQFGWKKKCEEANAAEIALVNAEAAVAKSEAKSVMASAKEAEAIAKAAEVDTLRARITFCLDMDMMYKSLNKELPKTVIDTCGDLI